MKTVLLLAHDDPGQEARYQVALDVTRALDGHLTCLDVIEPPNVLTYDYNSYGAMALVEDDREHEAANRSRLEQRLKHEDVSWSWHEASGFLASAIEGEVGLVDLIVLSTSFAQDEQSNPRQLAGKVARKVQRPVLAVPPNANGLDVTDTVLIAWDGSREAEEALRDAVPLLALSREVILFDLDELDSAFEASSAAKYLSRHGIHSRVDTASRKPGTAVYASLLEKAELVGASYIVMGAYGHSPTVEAIFGGVTRSMLTNTKLPLFLAH